MFTEGPVAPGLGRILPSFSCVTSLDVQSGAQRLSLAPFHHTMRGGIIQQEGLRDTVSHCSFRVSYSPHVNTANSSLKDLNLDVFANR